MSFVIPTAMAPKEAPLSKSIIPLKLASPKLEIMASLILPKEFTIPLVIVFTVFQIVLRICANWQLARASPIDLNTATTPLFMLPAASPT